jgi:hypothetical protein
MTKISQTSIDIEFYFINNFSIFQVMVDMAEDMVDMEDMGGMVVGMEDMEVSFTH